MKYRRSSSEEKMSHEASIFFDLTSNLALDSSKSVCKSVFYFSFQQRQSILRFFKNLHVEISAGLLK